jgi:hypothetical protein
MMTTLAGIKDEEEKNRQKRGKTSGVGYWKTTEITESRAFGFPQARVSCLRD